MRLDKRILKSPAAQKALAFVVAHWIRFTWRTIRWQRIGWDGLDAHLAAGKPLIVCFWHGRLAMMRFGWPDQAPPISILISAHPDGRVIAEAMHFLDIGTVKGSSGKPVTGAIREMRALLAAGECVGITPDGPKGPRMRAQMGAVKLAAMTGVPLLPATYSVSRRKVLGTWDRFLVPWPFGRGVYHWGPPIEVPEGADREVLEDRRRALEDAMNALTAEADQHCNQTAIAPAEPRVRAGAGQVTS